MGLMTIFIGSIVLLVIFGLFFEFKRFSSVAGGDFDKLYYFIGILCVGAGFATIRTDSSYLGDYSVLVGTILVIAGIATLIYALNKGMKKHFK